MTPEEKTRLVTKLTVENLGELAVGFGTDRLAKSVKITEALEALGTEASTMGSGVRAKASRLISRMADELMPQPMGVTPDGRLMPIPRDRLKNDANMLMSKPDDLGNSGRLVSKGVDATGKALTFTKDSGIELGAARLGQDGLWQEVPVVRGNEVHVGLRENLPSGTKTIDRVVMRDGIVESIKSIDPRLPSSESPAAFESKITDFIHKLEIYEGQTKPRQYFQIREKNIDAKVLHLGIPDGAITEGQVAVLNKVGKQVMEYNTNLPFDKAPIQIKVTVLQ